MSSDFLADRIQHWICPTSPLTAHLLSHASHGSEEVELFRTEDRAAAEFQLLRVKWLRTLGQWAQSGEEPDVQAILPASSWSVCHQVNACVSLLCRELKMCTLVVCSLHTPCSGMRNRYYLHVYSLLSCILHNHTGSTTCGEEHVSLSQNCTLTKFCVPFPHACE